MSNYLVHYGTPRHSGRYPYGSGERPFQRLEGSKGRLGKSIKKRFLTKGKKLFRVKTNKKKVKVRKKVDTAKANKAKQISKQPQKKQELHKQEQHKQNIQNGNNEQSKRFNIGTERDEYGYTLKDYNKMRKKKPSELTNNEMAALTKRYNAEKIYNDAYKQVTPKPKPSLMNRFVKETGDKVLKPAAEGIARDTLKAVGMQVAWNTIKVPMGNEKVSLRDALGPPPGYNNNNKNNNKNNNNNNNNNNNKNSFTRDLAGSMIDGEIDHLFNDYRP